MIRAFLFDLDGVFYVDDQLLPGANTGNANPLSFYYQ